MGGPYAVFWGSVCHIFCRNPLILTDFYAIQSPIVRHSLGAYFLQIWGVGVVRIIFNSSHFSGGLFALNSGTLLGNTSYPLRKRDWDCRVQAVFPEFVHELQHGEGRSLETGWFTSGGGFRTRPTTTRDRNLQFRGAVSTGGFSTGFFAFSPVFMCSLVRRAP